MVMPSKWPTVLPETFTTMPAEAENQEALVPVLSPQPEVSETSRWVMTMPALWAVVVDSTRTPSRSPRSPASFWTCRSRTVQ